MESFTPSVSIITLIHDLEVPTIFPLPECHYRQEAELRTKSHSVQNMTRFLLQHDNSLTRTQSLVDTSLNIGDKLTQTKLSSIDTNSGTVQATDHESVTHIDIIDYITSDNMTTESHLSHQATTTMGSYIRSPSFNCAIDRGCLFSGSDALIYEDDSFNEIHNTSGYMSMIETHPSIQTDYTPTVSSSGYIPDVSSFV